MSRSGGTDCYSSSDHERITEVECSHHDVTYKWIKTATAHMQRDSDDMLHYMEAGHELSWLVCLRASWVIVVSCHSELPIIDEKVK